MAFGADSTTAEVTAGLDLGGRTAVVTGATSGLGQETARALAAAGAVVVMTGRDVAKAELAATAVREQVPAARLHAEALDLTSLASIRASARRILDAHPRIDLLVNNAGVMATPFARTEDGFELQFGTNHLGHFLFTNLLVPALLQGAPARVVNLSSGGHVASDILWEDPNFEHTEYAPWTAYGQSKTANILFTLELDRRLAAHGVRSNAVHPGMVATNLGRYMTRDQGAALRDRASAAKLPPMKRIPAGAATQVWAATSPELDGVGGAYLEDCHISDAHATWTRDPEAAARLWDMSEELVNERFEPPTTAPA